MKDVIRSKIVLPCRARAYTRSGKEVMDPAYCRIELRKKGDGQELSIVGVVGPLNSGNCRGSAGQCVDDIRAGEPFGSWTSEMLEKLCDIWDEWHLNDMRPCCQHQKELGWDKKASEEVTIYHYTLKPEWISKKSEIKNGATERLVDGETVRLEDREQFIANLSYSYDSYEKLDSEYYAPKKPLYPGDKGFEKTKMLGWLRPDEHPDGILCRPCPVCGYKYGTAWLTEKVPEDVIEWLFSLPDNEGSDPAWV